MANHTCNLHLVKRVAGRREKPSLVTVSCFAYKGLCPEVIFSWEKKKIIKIKRPNASCPVPRKLTLLGFRGEKATGKQPRDQATLMSFFPV